MTNQVSDAAAKQSQGFIAEILTREAVAFAILDPQVQLVKNSPTMQILAGSIFAVSLLSGSWGTAATVAGCWLGARPLTHALAGTVASVGTCDDMLNAAIQRLETLALGSGAPQNQPASVQ